jgi:hypothetical protein
MDDFSAFTPGEHALLESLTRHGVRFMLVGASAAALPALEEALAVLKDRPPRGG